MKRWLIKTEPGAYAYADLVKEGRTRWDGIKNNTALIHLRKVKAGDELLVYHTGKEKQVVGVAQAITGPYPDPALDDERYVVVDIEPLRALEEPKTLKAMKADPAYEGFELLTNPRLSVMPVPSAIAKRILR